MIFQSLTKSIYNIQAQKDSLVLLFIDLCHFSSFNYPNKKHFNDTQLFTVMNSLLWHFGEHICLIIMASALFLQSHSASGQHSEMFGINSLQQYQVLAVNSTES